MLTAAIGLVVCSVSFMLWRLFEYCSFQLISKFYVILNNYLKFRLTMGEEIDFPSPEEQKEILSRKLAKSIIKGETWYLVNSKWLKSLKQFIGISPNGTYCVSQPGPIDNRPILTDDLRDLRKGLAEKIDFELVSEEVWNLLKAWYGMYPDQTPIARKAVMTGTNYTTVEIYLIDLKCYKNFDLHTELKIKMSKADKITLLHDNLRDKYSIPENTPTRLWMAYSDDKYNILNLDVTVQNSGLCDNQSVVLEVQSGGKWPKNGRSKLSSNNVNSQYCQPSTSRHLSNNSSVSLRPSRQTSNIHCNNPIKLPGVCGLNNLGNTCFMNSVLQCLSNTPPLCDYFLCKNHLRELNTTNPLGMKGEIAKAFGDLIQIIWSGRFSCTNPVHFKVQVSKFNAQFCGSQQHDAQELLTFLLDGLHEDLNRIIRKPYIESKDYTGQEDHVLAAESWNNYKLRNDSIIVDTFHGLLKSRVVCPECERFSVTFDPFCSLSLPLPMKKDRQLKVRFIPYEPTRRECLYKIIVPRRGLICDLCKEVSERTNVKISMLIVAEIINSHFHKFYSHEEYIDNIEDKDIIYVYEMTAVANDPKYVILPITFWESCEPNDKFSHNHLFGIPLLVRLQKENMTLDSITTTIMFHMKRHFTLPDTLYCNEAAAMTTNSDLETIYIPSLYLLDSGIISVNNPLRLEFNENGECLRDLGELLEVNDPDRIFGRKILVVQLSVDERQEYFSEVLPEYGTDINLSRPYSKDKILIDDCLDLFTTCEKLGVENAWYCPTCRKHQRATKKFDLWRLPQVLIVHLKRFSYARCGDKIDALVDFPLNNLNLYKYVINQDHQHISYDLIGVINHYGTMAGGHYTAYAFNKESQSWFYFDDNSVTPAKPEEIMTPTAYVLFYLRNNNRSPVDTPMDVN